MHREGGGGGDMLKDEESEEKGAFRSLCRKKATKTAVRSARAAVLRQNQKVSAPLCTLFSLPSTPDAGPSTTWARQSSPFTYLTCGMRVWEGAGGQCVKRAHDFCVLFLRNGSWCFPYCCPNDTSAK